MSCFSYFMREHTGRNISHSIFPYSYSSTCLVPHSPDLSIFLTQSGVLLLNASKGKSAIEGQGGRVYSNNGKKCELLCLFLFHYCFFEAGHVELSGERFSKAYPLEIKMHKKQTNGFRSMLFSKSRDEVDAGKQSIKDAFELKMLV